MEKYLRPLNPFYGYTIEQKGGEMEKNNLVMISKDNLRTLARREQRVKLKEEYQARLEQDQHAFHLQLINKAEELEEQEAYLEYMEDRNDKHFTFNVIGVMCNMALMVLNLILLWGFLG